jgi:hypothetical protein
MWAVPFVSKYWHALGICTGSVNSLYDLHRQMYKREPSATVNFKRERWYNYIELDARIYHTDVHLTATFKPKANAEMVVEIR